jgi:GT2 family glycosyltransferase
MCVPAERFRELGGFDERFRISEDRELSDRWRFRGGRVVYVPEAVVRHVRPLTLGGYVRQHFAYGRGAYRYHQERARRGSGRLRSDVGFHRELPGRLRRKLPRAGRRAPVLAGLLGIWQAANAAGFLYEKASDRRGTRGR